MGYNTYGLEYECDCDDNWGCCGKKNMFVLRYHRGSDRFNLYHSEHGKKLEHVLNGGDATLDAITHFLTSLESNVPHEKIMNKLKDLEKK